VRKAAPLRIVAAVVSLLVTPAIAHAERYALIVTGAAGGDAYEQKYTGWRTRRGVRFTHIEPSWKPGGKAAAPRSCLKMKRQPWRQVPASRTVFPC